MATYTGKDAAISFAATVISGKVVSPFALSKEAVIEDTTGYGLQDQAQTYAGMRKMKDVKFVALYDDTATTGSDALFVPIGTTVAVVVTMGGSKTASFSAVIKQYDRNFDPRGKLTKAEVTLAVSGAVTEV